MTRSPGSGDTLQPEQELECYRALLFRMLPEHVALTLLNDIARQTYGVPLPRTKYPPIALAPRSSQSVLAIPGLVDEGQAGAATLKASCATRQTADMDEISHHAGRANDIGFGAQNSMLYLSGAVTRRGAQRRQASKSAHTTAAAGHRVLMQRSVTLVSLLAGLLVGQLLPCTLAEHCTGNQQMQYLRMVGLLLVFALLAKLAWDTLTNKAKAI